MTDKDNPLKSPSRHSFFEDVQGLFTGTLLVALAVLFFKTSALLTGGTTGLAFLLHYPSGWPIGAILFVLVLVLISRDRKALLLNLPASLGKPFHPGS